MKPWIKKIIVLFLLFFTACAPQTTASQEPNIEMTAQIMAAQMQTATAESLPQALVATPTIAISPTPTAESATATATATSAPTQDYSQIRYLKAQTYYPSGGDVQTVFILEVGDISGDYTLIVHQHPYPCQQFAEYPGQLWCYGPYLPAGFQDIMYLYPQGADYGQATPIFQQVFGFPIEPTPTLFGVTCIYEPLSAIGQSTNSQCYAITCTYQGHYYGGTKNSCTDPWP